MTYYKSGEVFQKAVEMEIAGQKFYQALAEKTGKKELRDMCIFLAGEEKKHQIIFEKLLEKHQDFRADFSFDYYEYMEGLDLLSSEGFFRPDSGTVAELAASGDWKQLMLAAMRIERDSITYYQEMRPVVMKDAQAAIDGIIEQERAHFLKFLEIYRGKAD